MTRRLALVPLAILGALAAFAVSGAGGANISELLLVQGRLTQLDANGDGSCAVGSTTAIDVTLYSGGTVDQNGTGSDVFLWRESTGTSVRLTDHATRTSFEAYVDDSCRFVAYSTFTPPSTNDARLFDVMTGMETVVVPGAVVEDLSADGRYLLAVSQSTGQMLRHRIDGTEPPVVVTLDSAESPLPGSSFNGSISGDGGMVAFQNFQTSAQIYVRDIGMGTTQRISEVSGVPSGGLVPEINHAGTFVAYLRPGTIPELGILRHLPTGMDVVLGPVDDVPDVNDAGTVALVTPAALDAADTNGENDAYTLTLSGDATWLSRPLGGGAPAGGSHPFVGNVHVANGDLRAFFTSTRTNLGGASGVENGFRVVIGGGGGSSTSTTTTTTPAAPDVGVVKTAAAPLDGAYHRPNEQIIYTVTLTNHGTAPTQGVQLSDTIESANPGSAKPLLTLVDLPGSCGSPIVLPSEIGISCTFTPMAPGESRTVSYIVSVDRPGEVHNIATVSTPDDANASNDVDDAFVMVEPVASAAPGGAPAAAPDLVVSKTASQPAGSSFAPNEPIVYTITVVNEGNAAAHGVRLFDDLVSRVDVLEVANDRVPEVRVAAPGCSVEATFGEGPNVARPRGIGPGAQLRCFLDLIPAGGSKTVTYTVTASRATTLQNAAHAVPVEIDADPTDNTAALEVVVGEGRVNCSSRADCSGGAGDERVECEGARCFAGEGADTLECGAGAVCSGGAGEDRYRCSGERTVCSGGADDDVGTCVEEARCKEDGSDDLIACINTKQCDLGAGDDRVLCRFSVCRGQAGADFIRCDRSKCYGGDGPDVIRGGDGVETIDVADGDADRVDCGGGDRDLVVVDGKDRQQNCEFVLGADVLIYDLDVSTDFLASTPTKLVQRARVRVANHGPATATQVRLRITATIRDAEAGEARMDFPVAAGRGARCSRVRTSVDSLDPRTHVYTTTCTIPELAPGGFVTEFVLTLVTGRGEFEPSPDLILHAEVDAQEPDHRPANNEKLDRNFAVDTP